MDNDDKLEILLRLGNKISRENNLDRLLALIGDFSTEIVSAERCSIFIYDPQKDQLVAKVAHGIDHLVIPADKGVVGAAIQTGEIQISADPYHDMRFNQDVDVEQQFVTRSLLVIPLFNKEGKPLGAVEMINKNPGPFFNNIDAELMVLIANYVTSTIENALLYEKIKKTQTNLIYKLSTAAEFKDNETSAHTLRVAHYSATIARAMGRDQPFIDALTLVAPMHDIGKIGIPEAIIKKPGKLDNEEFAIMQQHALIGYQLLFDSDNDLLTMAARVSHDHHEKWSGGGYPKGIRGEEISLEGRIVAIADVFDALTTRRPYKEPWSIERSLGYIEEQQGGHFDPDLARTFLAERDAVAEIFCRHQEEPPS
ncbi:MAG: HD domain-containing protein [Gammaproteobacteria bacterium]|nr:HD domain-containing protein [Gammaproteobacteria bacterium]